MQTRVAPVPKTSAQPPKRLRQRIGSPFTSSGSPAGRLTPLRSCTVEPKPLSRPPSEIACVERIGAAGPAVAYGSAVNEDGGNRTCVLAERRNPPGSDAKPYCPDAKNVSTAAKTFAPTHRFAVHIERLAGRAAHAAPLDYRRAETAGSYAKRDRLRGADWCRRPSRRLRLGGKRGWR
jgi:hypothetical protein